MRDKCDEIHRKQYKQLMTLFITLCLESHDRYYFNVLRMITIFIICTLSMKYMPWHIKKRTILHDSLFMQNTMSKLDGDITWEEILR